jgi:hypothetical protein
LEATGRNYMYESSIKMPIVYQEVEVEVELDDFDTEDLIEELERRGAGGHDYGDGKELLTAVYEKRRLAQDYQADLDQLIYLGLGKIV